MTRFDESPSADDPFELSRFVQAQDDDYYERALAELISGRKRSHWMWFVFPQLSGLGFSATSRFYAVKSIDEARSYVAHPILGPRLFACAEAVLRIEGRSAADIFGHPDDLKMQSCATLFAVVLPRGSVFCRVLEEYYGGRGDEKTLHLLGIDPENWQR